MSFPVNNTNNTRITIVDDYSIDTTSSLRLLGTGIVNYGQIMAENLVRMMEHFASPGNPHPSKEWEPTSDILANPQIGQIWFHTYVPGPPSVTINRMRYWTGVRWETFTFSVNTATEPPSPQLGDMWFDRSCAQLVYWGPLEGVAENPDSSPTWINLNSSIKRESPPKHPAHGAMWWMLPEGQLWMYDSESPGACRPVGYKRQDGTTVPGGWTLIGPMSSMNDATFIQATKINGHNALEYWIDGHVPAIWSDRDQILDPRLNDGYDDFLTYSTDGMGNITMVSALKKGLNLNLNTCNILNGVAMNAMNLDSWGLIHFYRNHLDLIPTLIDGTTASDNTRKIGKDGTRFSQIHSVDFYGGDSTTTTKETHLDFPPSPYTNTLISTTLPVQFHGRADRALYSDACRLSLLTVQWQTPRFTSISGHVQGVADTPNSTVDGTRAWSYSVAFTKTADDYMDARSTSIFNKLITPYATRITNLENRMTAAEGRLTTDEHSIAQLNNALSTINTRLANDDARLNDYQSRLTNIETRLNADDVELEGHQHLLDDHQAELDEHQRRLDAGNVGRSLDFQLIQNTPIANRKALLAGITVYSDHRILPDLQGPDNDIALTKQMLVNNYSFDVNNVTSLNSAAATRVGIINALSSLVRNARSGDVIFFHYSGHGGQCGEHGELGTLDGSGNVIPPSGITMHDALFPSNTALKNSDLANNILTLQNYILDTDLQSILDTLPANVEFVMLSDSCNSGDLTRAILTTPQLYNLLDIAKAHLSLGGKVSTFDRSLINGHDPIGLISGCASNEESASLSFDIGNGQSAIFGVATYVFVNTILAPGGSSMSLTSVVDTMRRTIQQLTDNYAANNPNTPLYAPPQTTQVPQLRGPDEIINFPFLNNPGNTRSAVLNLNANSSNLDAGMTVTYSTLRSNSYPNITDQLDALWHAMNSGILTKVPAFYDPIAEIKAKYPKPTV